MRKQIGLISLLVLFLLAACSGQASSPTALPAGTTSPSQTGQSGSTFLVQISGNVTGALSSDKDKVQFFKIPNGGEGYTLSFTRADGLLNVQVLFYTNTAPAAGTYTFSLDYVDGSVLASAYDQSGTPQRSFTQGIGQIVLQKTGDAYSGNFEFTSTGGEPGSSDQNITVGASFKDIQLQGQ